MKNVTKGLTLSTSVIPAPTRGGPTRLSPNHLLELVTRLCLFKAERWGRRALFYERHRGYFPRMSAGRFVQRCRQLEARYRALAQMMFLIPTEDRLVPARMLALSKQ
ncbi:hypothetical protein [Candidatus Nitrospira nitrificans]|jgi:hypothetical protein|uniref:Uncharacterized protein n=1 Tax=Candidatus Nitrospira nitrificans TaxID=1742973 RepID=A0A0S4LSF3_9BACT|nr:hypothetical protein [Candidatus Nitrospira nitrificans]CUS38964.1 conserved exported hypothetical protein [Candidatus Nitrospira nitrificans]